jgi:hypothetical protein
MLRRALSLCAVLGLASSAYAGATISLAPSAPANPLGYAPGEVVNIGVFAQLDAGTPSVPGPAGTTTAIRVRLMQFDLSDTSPALLAGIAPVGHHPLQETQPFAGAIPFWDYSSTTVCAGDETGCGTNYFVDGELPGTLPNIFNTTYSGSVSSGGNMISLNQTAPKKVGELQITMPAEGSYVLDLLNADNTDPNLGAEIRWGFGSASDPTDPTSPLRATVTAATGISGGQLPLTVVPEPATLAMLGLGGLAAAFRRRRSA